MCSATSCPPTSARWTTPPTRPLSRCALPARRRYAVELDAVDASAEGEEEKTARENGIALLESGDYEGALDQFEALIQDADRVTDFEVDILKYRAEAEYVLRTMKLPPIRMIS